MPNSAISTCTPPSLYQEIEAAESIDRLRELGAKMLDIVRAAARTGADTKSIVHLISRFNSAITQRLIALLESAEGLRLPEGVAYLALGSEGRGEQTLCTDQDSAIVYIDDLPPEKLRDVERFATRLVDALEEIGFPRCPGNIMASTSQWRHSLTEWKRLLDQWITAPTPEHMLDFCMFQDLRPLYGDGTLCMQLRDHIRAAVRLPAFFFPNMACHAVRFPPPLTIFGRIRVEQSGEHKGKVDIKKAGIFAVTVGASLLALEAGFVGGNTWEKLELLGKRRVLTAGDLKTIEEAFTFLVQLRLQWQLRELAASGKPTNFVDPRVMTDKERYQFQQALKGVNAFLWIINNRYQLNFISH
jgi:CBS domain-containing protein